MKVNETKTRGVVTVVIHRITPDKVYFARIEGGRLNALLWMHRNRFQEQWKNL